MNTNYEKAERATFYTVSGLLVLKLLLLRLLLFDRIAWEWVAADAAPVLFLTAMLAVAVPRRLREGFLWGFNVLFSLLLFAVSVYFNQFGSVPTYHALAELNQVLQVKESAGAAVRGADYFFFADLAFMLVLLVWRKVRSRRGFGTVWSESGTHVMRASSVRRRPGRVYLVCLLTFLIGGGALSVYTIGNARGITNELVRAESAGLINYEIIAALKARDDRQFVASGDIEETKSKIAAHQSAYDYVADRGGAPSYFGMAQRKNVIVIQLESFQNFPLHQSLEGTELTPVLNRLADEGYYFPHIYQQIGPGNTSDAEFISNTSLYPIATEAMSTGFGSREMPGLPRLLQSKGYESYTFHVNSAGFWNRNELYPALGFDGYFDKNDFRNDQFNSFGASDEELYRTGVEELAKLKQRGVPFYAQFVTVSSHHPFKVQESFRRMELPASLEDTMLGNYLLSVNYADYAVGRLIEGLKEAGMWEDTLLVLYGDHFGLQPQDVPPEQVAEALGIPYHPRISRFNIPFIIRVPEMEQGQVVERTGGQVDMMPTLANLLGVDPRESGDAVLGQDLLNVGRNVAGMRYYLPTGSFFNDDILFVPGTGFEDGEAVSLDTLQPVEDFGKYRSDYDYILRLMSLSDEYVKLLPLRSD